MRLCSQSVKCFRLRKNIDYKFKWRLKNKTKNLWTSKKYVNNHKRHNHAQKIFFCGLVSIFKMYTQFFFIFYGKLSISRERGQ